MRWLALAFIVVPLVELWLLLRVGDVIGFWPTVGMVMGMAVLGAWLAKREGLRVLRSWRRALAEFRVPEEGVTSGVLVLVGAVLLMTPGVLTDVLGIAFLVPATRRVIARVLEKRLGSRFTIHTRGFDVGGSFTARGTTGRPGAEWSKLGDRGDPGGPVEPRERPRTVEVDAQVLDDREIKGTR